MIKIDLSEYKNSKIYFKLFDVILKNISITKRWTFIMQRVLNMANR